MSANFAALIVAVVGVAGTLFAALLTQRSYVRIKQLELNAQRELRIEEDRRVSMQERRDSYIALNVAVRRYRRALKNLIIDPSSTSKEELQNARREFEYRLAEGQLIARDKILPYIHSVSANFGSIFSRVVKLDTVTDQNADTSEREKLIAELDVTLFEGLSAMRNAMREDLEATNPRVDNHSGEAEISRVNSDELGILTEGRIGSRPH